MIRSPFVSRAAYDALQRMLDSTVAELERRNAAYDALVTRVTERPFPTTNESRPGAVAVGDATGPRAPAPLPQRILQAIAMTTPPQSREWRLMHDHARELLAAGFSDVQVKKMILEGQELPI